MDAVAIFGIIFGCSLLALAIIASTILMAIKILKGGVSRKGQEFQAKEARMIQEMYIGLEKLEKRLESLETIILDHERKDRE